MEKYNITGMSCAACAARVEKAVSGVEGVTSCSVNLLTNSMGVEGTAGEKAIIDAVVSAGYGAKKAGTKAKESLSDAEESLRDTETPKLKKRLLVSLGFLLVLMYFSMGHHMFGFPVPKVLHDAPATLGLIQLILTVIIMVINQRFFTSGYRALFHRAPNMDTLVSLGATAAFVYSTAALFMMIITESTEGVEAARHYLNEFYFESAGMILTLITLGKMLEAKSKGRTTNALKSLISLSPKTARVVRDGAEAEVPLEDVKVGDIFVLRPGDSVPVDGVVIEGESALNESSLTGESVPVDKAAGDRVSAGTLNTSGYLECRAERVGEDTALNRIIKLVSDASATKAPIAKIADKISGIFVPTVMAIALLTTVVWLIIGKEIGFALARGISVLVISCPCALGLATPVAIMVGSGVGAKNGILFKSAVSLEQTGKAQIIALDKTGTVTKGEMRVTDVIPASEGIDLVSLAYTLESKSEHPLAKAIVAYAKENGTELCEAEGFKALSGSGVEAAFDGKRLVGGSVKFISREVGIPKEALDRAEALAKGGKTPLAFARDGVFAGLIAVSDVIKEDSADAVSSFRNMGIRTVLLTGDNKLTAQAIAESAGVDEVVAGVLPDGKAKVIEDLKRKGSVIMIGDGVNDAPALTLADTGIAIGAGTDVAIDAAEVVLMKNTLRDAAAALRLSRATLRNIKQNLFWAFFYNLIGIPLAAGVFIPLFGWEMDPMYGAAAMSLSSFFVVTNALRLNFFDVYSKKHDKRYKNTLDENVVLCDNIADTNENTEDIKMKTIKIEGMMCTHCSGRVKKALEEIDGVKSADVSHETGEAKVETTKDVPASVLTKAVEDAGYKVTGLC